MPPLPCPRPERRSLACPKASSSPLPCPRPGLLLGRVPAVFEVPDPLEAAAPRCDGQTKSSGDWPPLPGSPLPGVPPDRPARPFPALPRSRIRPVTGRRPGQAVVRVLVTARRRGHQRLFQRDGSVPGGEVIEIGHVDLEILVDELITEGNSQRLEPGSNLVVRTNAVRPDRGRRNRVQPVLHRETRTSAREAALSPRQG